MSNLTSPKYPSVKIEARPSHERGQYQNSWLKAFHSFSVPSYQDKRYMRFGSIRIINEDRVAPSNGFGLHPHSEMEIFTYIVSGELEHKDSMGNVEALKRGDVQLTSAGTGIRHSESNSNASHEAHLLQIWAYPSTDKLTPAYYTRHFTDEEKKDTLVRIVAPFNSRGVTSERDGAGPAPVHSPITLYATLISPTKSVTHVFPASVSAEPRKAYVQLPQTSGHNAGEARGARVRLNGGLELSEGDAAFVWGQEGDILEIENVGSELVAEVLVFDIE
ncbi:hypothetical protein BOTBODRAFT_27717 [Botryobasidium botryosum FD-172 SS1]|uniref:Pirin N-terminal domain-containing protein n=1 Tax=Botryobasidium botryosum (strain FD-172 SS1) TaxID=930990 RepID=A0A067MX39_BOTB1|nr:hypothetical protein BOTBODRAFT_27717 [Botryobasidium botryosum FD-172 SS1]